MAKRRVKDIQQSKQTRCKVNETYDCAFLEPLAFPPDLPPVILSDLDVY